MNQQRSDKIRKKCANLDNIMTACVHSSTYLRNSLLMYVNNPTYPELPIFHILQRPISIPGRVSLFAQFMIKSIHIQTPRPITNIRLTRTPICEQSRPDAPLPM